MKPTNQPNKQTSQCLEKLRGCQCWPWRHSSLPGDRILWYRSPFIPPQSGFKSIMSLLDAIKWAPALTDSCHNGFLPGALWGELSCDTHHPIQSQGESCKSGSAPLPQIFLPENPAEGHNVFASLSSTEGTFSILVGDRESFIYSTYSRVITGLFKKHWW